MANTSIQAQNGSTGGLPTPKVKLVTNDSTFGAHPVNIQHSDNAGTFKLYRYPTVVANDLTEQQIEDGVYVEMAHYVRGKSPSAYNTNKNEAGYVVPAPWIGGINPFNGDWTRGGHHNGTGDRPNHYQVLSINEEIPVFEYLHNRHIEKSVGYYDISGIPQWVVLKIRRARNHASNYPGKAFMYSAKYQPYYFMFRYVMKDKTDDRQWVSGPWSRVVKMAYKEHPFNVDAQASAIIGRQVGTVNPLLNVDEMQCWFETRLP